MNDPSGNPYGHPAGPAHPSAVGRPASWAQPAAPTYPTGPHPAAAPGPYPVAPPVPQPGWPGGQPVPGQPGPGGPSPYPAAPVPPARGGRGTVWLVLAVAVVLLLGCGGAAGYVGWFRPWYDAKQRAEAQNRWGAPDGFTEMSALDNGSAETRTVVYEITCQGSVCPVDVPESLYAWLVRAGRTDLDPTDIRNCVVRRAQAGADACSDWRWRWDGYAVRVETRGTLPLADATATGVRTLQVWCHLGPRH
ncbi:hypothetical protein AB0K04_00465 [Micromonospora coxensis]|uniref:hypothetical protein n=1 Tax=Micromonospora coxensis TaxID=356852 RepID=UPI00342799CE